MYHNYSSDIIKYQNARIEAMTKHIKKLEDKIEFLKSQIEINKESYYE